MRKYVLQDPDVFEELEQTDKRTSNLSRYVMEKGGFPTYKNYHTTYYPWGKDKLEALIEELNKAEKFIFMEYFIVAERKDVEHGTGDPEKEGTGGRGSPVYV